MNIKSFLTGLIITLTAQLIVSFGLLLLLPEWRIHIAFIVICIGIMAFFCFSLYKAAQIVARSTMTRLFIQLVMIAVFIKLFLCLAIVVVYKKAANPADNAFIWPFLFIYITSTIYEVVFLEKVGRQKTST